MWILRSQGIRIDIIFNTINRQVKHGKSLESIESFEQDVISCKSILEYSKINILEPCHDNNFHLQKHVTIIYSLQLHYKLKFFFSSTVCQIGFR